GLLEDDPATAEPLAARLDELNRERRSIEARMQQVALGAVRCLADPGPGALQRSGVCLFDESWHQGVVGLVASRVKDRLRRPVIAFALADEASLRGPWGQAFPEPCFDGLFSIRSARVVAERHVKMWVEVPSGGRAFDAMAFNHLEEGAQFVPPAGLAQLVYRLEVNEYQGERRLQLLIDHLLPAAR